MKKERKTMREEEKGDCREEGERMAGGGGEKRKLVLKGGCIKEGKRGPWLVHRTTKDGSVVTRFRYPSDKERQNNKRRERERRSVTQKIFQGLRAHGNYRLPKYSDSNDLLKALCDEAGWHVDEDGHVSRKSFTAKMTSFISGHTSCPVSIDGEVGYHEDYCQCDHDKFNAKVRELKCTFFPVATSRDQYDQIDLALSLSPSPS